MLIRIKPAFGLNGLVITALSVGLITLISCGGGGGSSASASTTSTSTSSASSTSTSTTTGTIPPANEPTCSGNVVSQAIQSESAIRAHLTGTILIPESTIERSSDIGVRMHSNHLVRIGVNPAIPGGGGYTPAQIRTAYNIPSSGGQGAIAIVDAFDDPNALSDFNTFSAAYSLPTESSTTATASTNSVFQVVYASGAQPNTDASWAQEVALDTQWSHAMAPGAKIYLVEAASDNLSDLMAAVNIAKALPNVTQVSISFGASETACEYVQYNSYFIKSGVTFFVAGGDNPNETQFPAGSYNVISVGGTTLTTGSTGTYIRETAWNDTSCGPSSFEPRPAYQNSIDTIVQGYRGVTDISADADPNTGVNVYDSIPYQGVSGWLVEGGTSAACPIIAGIANLANSGRTSSQAFNLHLYSMLGTGSFHDITSGASGSLRASTGWDFPTGVGTPNGIGGF